MWWGGRAPGLGWDLQPHVKFGWGGMEPKPCSAPRRKSGPLEPLRDPWHGPGCEPLPWDAVGCWGGRGVAAPWLVPWVPEATVLVRSGVRVSRAIPPSSPPWWVSLQPVINGPREAVVAAGHG